MTEFTNNLQVCFAATTQYHLLVSDIYARYIYDKFGIVSKIITRKYKGFDYSRFKTDNKYHLIPIKIYKGNIFKSSLFALKCGYLFNLTQLSKQLDRSRSIFLFIFNDRSKLTKRLIDQAKAYDSNNKIILLDEGNDTYADHIEVNIRLWQLKHTISKILFGSGRSSLVIGEDKSIDIAIVRNAERYSGLRKAKNQVVLQQSEQLLERAGAFFENYQISGSVSHNCDVLYLGQPYYKDGKKNSTEEKCISEILAAIPEQYRVLIKPHPRDKGGKYLNLKRNFPNVEIVEEDLSVMPVEALMSITNTKCVITIQSSAALTLADMLPDISVFILRSTNEAKRMLSDLEKKGEELPNLDEEFFKSKNGNIYIPDTLETFAMLIEKHMNHASTVKHNYQGELTEIETVLQIKE